MATIPFAARSIATALYALHFYLNLRPHAPDSAAKGIVVHTLTGSRESWALSIFKTNDVMFHCLHYGIRVYTMWSTWLSVSLLHHVHAGFKRDIADSCVCRPHLLQSIVSYLEVTQECQQEWSQSVYSVPQAHSSS